MGLPASYVTGKFASYLGDVRTTSVSLAVWLVDDYTKKEPTGNIKVTVKDRVLMVIKNLSGYHIFTDLGAGKYAVIVESDFYFPEEKIVDTSRIKIQDTSLSFYTVGPAAGATSTKLKDVSKLQREDIVEFRKIGIKERRVITNIKITTKEIFWTDGLKYDFNTSDSAVVALKNPVVEFTLKPEPCYPFPGNATLIRGLVTWAAGTKRGLPVDNANVKVVGKNIGTITDKNGEFVLFFKGIKKEDIAIEIRKDSAVKTINTTSKGENITIEEGKTRSVGVIVFP